MSSVLKALAGLQGRDIDWSKTKVFWVNHKASKSCSEAAGSSVAVGGRQA